jgi:hypothetical protein
MTGVRPFRHFDPRNRPLEVFGGVNTLHFDEGHEPFILLPVVPSSNG